MRAIGVDYDYVQTLALEIKQGRGFSKEFSEDEGGSVIVNEKAIETLGLAEPISSELLLPSGKAEETRRVRVIGVVKDFHLESLHSKIEPMVLVISEQMYNVMLLRHRPGNISETAAYIESVYRKFNPETPFSLGFLDERYDAMYRTEQRVGQLSSYFAVIAIFIASLGLYGLASYVAEQRTKEIGIRKVLGASVPALFTLMSRSFVFLAAIANLIAWPVAYYIAADWLQNFAYRIDIGWWVFALAGGLALVIALLTVSAQAVRAALANPVESLRYE